MTQIPLGRLVDLQTSKDDGSARFKVGLEHIEGRTGRLLNAEADYAGDGKTFIEGDVLFGKLRPYLAKVWRADRPGSAVGDFHVYRPRPEIASRYLAYSLLADSFIGPVVSSVYGAKMPRASWDFVRSLELHTPAFRIQEAIADYLDRETAKIDTLIAKQERLIAALRERRQGTVDQHLDTTSFRPARLSRLAQITDCLHITAEFIDNSTYPVASIHECRGPVVDLTNSRGTTAEYFDLLRSGGRDPQPNDLLFIRNVSVGLVSRVTDDVPDFAVGQETVLIRPRTDVDSRFLRHLFTSTPVREQIEQAMIGATFRRLNVSALAALRLKVPGLEEQRSIANEIDRFLTEIDTLISKAERFIELSKERRAALITAAVTGQIEVPAG